jgi:hypothetical protein
MVQAGGVAQCHATPTCPIKQREWRGRGHTNTKGGIIHEEEHVVKPDWRKGEGPCN